MLGDPRAGQCMLDFLTVMGSQADLMNHPRRSVLFKVASGLILAVFLSACDDDSALREKPQDAEPAPELVSEPISYGSPRIDLLGIEMGTSLDADGRVSIVTSQFKREDTIYASLTTQGSADDVRLKVSWTYQDGQSILSEIRSVSPVGPHVHTFSMKNPAGWPAGDYSEPLRQSFSVQ